MIPFIRSQYGTVIVETIRCLQDNYVYFVGLAGSQKRSVIDPGEASPVLAFLEQEHLTLESVLNTHHHHDHVGGNLELQERFRIPAFASAHDASRIPGCTRGFEEGERFRAAGVDFLILAIPGHTLGQIAYFHDGSRASTPDSSHDDIHAASRPGEMMEPLVFVGDTLFSLGCGRLFEGTPAQMLDSLKKLMRLPTNTRLFTGHEYTLRNAEFARGVDPTNPLIEARADSLRKAFAPLAPRQQIAPALMLTDESKSNPFLRADQSAIASALGIHEATDEKTELAVFTRLRGLRNEF